MNQRGRFSQNIFQSILFDWDLFWSWSFKFKITNHFYICLLIDWLRGTTEIKLEELLFWGISSKLFLLFSLVWFCFCLFLCLFYVLICLYSLFLGSLCIFKHVRLLVSSFKIHLLCFWARVFEQTCARMHPTCARRSNYACARKSKYAYACS